MAQFKHESVVIIRYSVKSFVHTHTLGVRLDADPATGGIPTGFVDKSGVTQTFASAMSSYGLLLEELFADDCTIDTWEVWDYRDDGANIPNTTYVVGGSFGLTGNRAGGTTLIGQVTQSTFSYRAESGRAGRVVLIGASESPYDKLGRPFTPRLENIATYFEGPSSWLRHPDGNSPSNFYSYRTTTNNAMERRIHRSG